MEQRPVEVQCRIAIQHEKVRNPELLANARIGDEIYNDRGRSAVPIIYKLADAQEVPQYERTVLDLEEHEAAHTMQITMPMCDYLRTTLDSPEDGSVYPFNFASNTSELCRSAKGVSASSYEIEDDMQHQAVKIAILDRSICSRHNEIIGLIEELPHEIDGLRSRVLELVALSFDLGIRVCQADVVLSGTDAKRQTQSFSAERAKDASSQKAEKRRQVYRDAFERLGKPRNTKGHISSKTYSSLRLAVRTDAEQQGIKFDDPDERTIREYLKGM